MKLCSRFHFPTSLKTFALFNFWQKPGGIVALLDEAWYNIFLSTFFLTKETWLCSIIFQLCKPTFFSCSMFPKSTHETFANKLYQTFKNHKRFIKPKLSRTDFTISHYAGEVCMLFNRVFTIMYVYMKFHNQSSNRCELLFN